MAFRLCEKSEMSKTKAAFLMTECKPKAIEFHTLGSREVVGHFDGGDITSDAGGLMPREVEQRTGILNKFGACLRIPGKSARHSNRSRPLIPEQSVQSSERSDAGVNMID